MKRKMIAVLTAVSTIMAVLSPGISVAAQVDGESSAAAVSAEVETASESRIAFKSEYPALGQALEVEVSGLEGELSYEWYVGGKLKGTGTSYTPVYEDLEQFIYVKVSSSGENAEASIFFSKLPVIYINTENSAPILDKVNYIPSQLVIQGNETYNTETTTLYNGTAGVRGRGNSTWSLPKKPYKIKLDKSTNLLGFGKSKHWVLLANYYDTTYMRNKLSYDLAGDMGMPYMQSILTDVVLNGEYVGNYQLCEQVRIDKNRVNILNWEDEAEDAADAIAEANGLSDELTDKLKTQMAENLNWVTTDVVQLWDQELSYTEYTVSDYYDIPEIDGGYLLELDTSMDELSCFKTNYNQPMMFNTPEYAFTNDEMMDYVRGYIQAFEDAVYSDNYCTVYEGEEKHYSQLFDMDSLVDYWIVNEIFFNQDFMKKSTYMYKDNDGLFYMGPIWDMDWTSGSYQTGTWQWDYWNTLYYNDGAQAVQWYKRLVQDPYFLKLVNDRYWEIRDTYIQKMLDSIDPMYDYLKESANASFRAWDQDSYHGTYEQVINNFKYWMNGRIEFLDSKMATYDTFAAEFMKTADKLTAVYEDGTALAKDSISPENAAYDCMAFSDRSLKITAETLKNSSEAELWINGVKVERKAVTGGKAEFVIPAGFGDSVIQIYGYESGSSAANGAAYLSVKANIVAAIKVTPPEKLEYEQGETLDQKGLEVKAAYLDGTERVVTEEAEITGYTPETAGTQEITVSYAGRSATFTVTVKVQEPEPSEKPVESVSFGQESDTMGLGEEKTLYVTVKPEDANDAGQITWTSSDESILTVDEEGNVKALWPGEATITAKAGDVSGTLKVTVTGVEKIYTDVKTDDWFYQVTNWAYINKVMGGYGDGTFGPADKLARAQFAVILYRIAGEPEAEIESRFPDVKEGDWYYDAVVWANQNQIITGYSDSGLFGPADSITREQLAVIMYRYAVKKGYPVDEKADFSTFEDASQVNAFAAEAMGWAVGNGIITGKNNGTVLDPQGNAARAECAAIVMRFAGKYKTK